MLGTQLLLMGTMMAAAGPLVGQELDAVRDVAGEPGEVKAVAENFVIQIGSTTIYAVAGEDYVLEAITDVWLDDGTYVPAGDPLFIGYVVVEGVIGNAGDTDVLLTGQDTGIVVLPVGYEAKAGCSTSCSCSSSEGMCHCSPVWDEDREMDCCNCYRSRSGVDSCSCVAAEKQ